jgi:hypothetical protein
MWLAPVVRPVRGGLLSTYQVSRRSADPREGIEAATSPLSKKLKLSAALLTSRGQP